MPSPGLKHATRYYLNRFWSTLVEMSGVSPAPQEPEGSFVRPPDEFDEYDPPPPAEYHHHPGTRDRGMLRHGMYNVLTLKYLWVSFQLTKARKGEGNESSVSSNLICIVHLAPSVVTTRMNHPLFPSSHLFFRYTRFIFTSFFPSFPLLPIRCSLFPPPHGVTYFASLFRNTDISNPLDTRRYFPLFL